eukprot:TRINITY_DN1124_c0_g1_i2.p1 TRINITY_DN1124_c0_g1~~TRINITY_DN1124_c0_g1_i2.p1  ORF type:complete len:320 (-),score=29.18 TRINITY_DN1124_c0_g1_i2:1405-2364(-)
MSGLTVGKVHHLLYSLSEIRKAIFARLSWVQILPAEFVSACRSLGELTIHADQPLDLVADSKLHDGAVLKYNTLLKSLHKDRQSTTFISSLVCISHEFVVSVGQIAEIRSPDTDRNNWYLYVTELHISGFGEPGGTGFFLYSQSDIRQYKTCSRFTCAEKEFLLTNHKFNFIFSNVTVVVDIKPLIFYRGKATETGFFKSFFDTSRLAVRKIVFPDQTELFPLVQGLQSDAICRNSSLFASRESFSQIFILRLVEFLVKKGPPTTPPSPSISISLPSLDTFLSLPDFFLKLSVFNQLKHSFVLVIEKTTSQLDFVFGKK